MAVRLVCNPVSCGVFSSFELPALSFKNKPHPIFCLLIYRPPKPNSNFADEFSELLSLIMPNHDRVLILGDFNIHTCCTENNFAQDCISLLESFNLTHHVTGPTHNGGHTLDLVITHGLSLQNLDVLDGGISDHYSVSFDVLCPQPPRIMFSPIRSRTINSSTAGKFCDVFTASPAPSIPSHQTADLLNTFNNLCKVTLDIVAPGKNQEESICKIIPLAQ